MQKMQGKQFVNFFHIGKTGGSAIKKAKRLKKSLFQFYCQNLCKSTATVLRGKILKGNKSIEWLQSSELTDIYSTMKPVRAKPNFSKIEKIFNRDSIPRTSVYPKQNTLGVIVETRKQASLEFVITDFIQQTGLNVQLFHGTNNRQDILTSEIRRYVDTGQVTLYELRTDKLDAPMYNALFLSKAFWEAMISRGKIFVFQTDSCICKKSEFSLNDFLRFDYIGSRRSRKRPIGLILDGGSGGLSIRDWQKSVKCLEVFPPPLWKGGEDGYFAFHIELLGGKVGKNRDCGKFSTQNIFSHKSYGAHKISLLSRDQKLKFVGYCPEAKFLLG